MMASLLRIPNVALRVKPVSAQARLLLAPQATRTFSSVNTNDPGTQAGSEQNAARDDTGGSSGGYGREQQAVGRGSRKKSKALARPGASRAPAQTTRGTSQDSPLLDLRRGIDDIFRSFERDFFRDTPLSMMPSFTPFSPLPAVAPLTQTLLSTVPIPAMSLDVKQTDNAYVVKVEIPGVDKENVNVEIDQALHAITITTEEKGDTTEEGEESTDDESGERFLMRERAWGRAQRTVHFPDDADLDNVQDPQMKNGVLIVNVPKRQGEQSKRKLQIKGE